MTNGYDFDWSSYYNSFSNMPGMGSLLSGGMPFEGYDPTQHTGETARQFQDILAGKSDMPTVGASKYATPMREQTKMAAKGAGQKATTSLRAREGRGFDPAAASYFESMFGAMPAFQEPGINLASQQAASAENAPIIAANAAAKQAAMAGLTNLAGINASVGADMAGLKYSTMNSALAAGVNALTSMMGSAMGYQSQMAPTYNWSSPGAFGMNWSGKWIPPGYPGGP